MKAPARRAARRPGSRRRGVHGVLRAAPRRRGDARGRGRLLRGDGGRARRPVVRGEARRARRGGGGGDGRRPLGMPRRAPPQARCERRVHRADGASRRRGARASRHPLARGSLPDARRGRPIARRRLSRLLLDARARARAGRPHRCPRRVLPRRGGARRHPANAGLPARLRGARDRLLVLQRRRRDHDRGVPAPDRERALADPSPSGALPLHRRRGGRPWPLRPEGRSPLRSRRPGSRGGPRPLGPCPDARALPLRRRDADRRSRASGPAAAFPGGDLRRERLAGRCQVDPGRPPGGDRHRARLRRDGRHRPDPADPAALCPLVRRRVRGDGRADRRVRGRAPRGRPGERPGRTAVRRAADGCIGPRPGRRQRRRDGSRADVPRGRRVLGRFGSRLGGRLLGDVQPRDQARSARRHGPDAQPPLRRLQPRGRGRRVPERRHRLRARPGCAALRHGGRGPRCRGPLPALPPGRRAGSGHWR